MALFEGEDAIFALIIYFASVFPNLCETVYFLPHPED
jgi:hypothetical protein